MRKLSSKNGILKRYAHDILKFTPLQYQSTIKGECMIYSTHSDYSRNGFNAIVKIILFILLSFMLCLFSIRNQTFMLDKYSIHLHTILPLLSIFSSSLFETKIHKISLIKLKGKHVGKRNKSLHL